MGAKFEIVEYIPNTFKDDGSARAEFNSYTDAQWKIRVDFVQELVKDRNPVAAAMRIGYSNEAAKEESARFLLEPAVQKILEEIRCPPWLSKGKTEAQKQILAGLWAEANYTGWGATPGARISALKALATLLKMEPTHETLKLPDLVNMEAFAALELEEQKLFAQMVRKVAVKAKAKK